MDSLAGGSFYVEALTGQIEKEVEKYIKRIDNLGGMIDMKVQVEQVKFLQKIRAERNNEDVKNKLAGIKTCAEGDSNLMPCLVDAVKSYASIGEICNNLREVFGEYRESVFI